MRLARSLRGRVALAALAAAAVVVAMAGTALIATAGKDERRDLDQQLERRARGFGPGPPGLGARFGGSEQLLAGSDEFVRLIRDGEVVLEFGGGPEGGELPLPDKTGFDTVEVDGESWRTFTEGPPGPPPGAPGDGDGPPGGRESGRVQVATSLGPLESRVASRRRAIVLVGLGALAAAGGLGLAFGGVALRPLARLREAAARVGSTRDLDARVPPGAGPEEVEALAQSINEMLARLEESSQATEAALEASRRFSAGAGHELRTPLTSMSANLAALARNPDMPEADRQRALDGLRSELDRLTGVLDALQELARGDSGRVGTLEEVDLAEVADAAAASARTRHPGLELSVGEANGAVPLTGSPAGLRLILDNLLENAAVHGGHHAELAVEARDGVAVVTVDDDGPGIRSDERERVLERFTRGSRPSGQGSGLGLAIVHQQASLHGGNVRISESPLGGARVTIELGGRDRGEA
jgi:two-component system, OmpR family, sensor histidine kinase PrrB